MAVCDMLGRHRPLLDHRLQLLRGPREGVRGRPPRLGGTRAGRAPGQGGGRGPQGSRPPPAAAALLDCRLRAGARPPPSAPGRGPGPGALGAPSGPHPRPRLRTEPAARSRRRPRGSRGRGRAEGPGARGRGPGRGVSGGVGSGRGRGDSGALGDRRQGMPLAKPDSRDGERAATASLGAEGGRGVRLSGAGAGACPGEEGSLCQTGLTP